MVQSLQLQSQQSRGDFHHFVHLKDTANLFLFYNPCSKINTTLVNTELFFHLFNKTKYEVWFMQQF